MTSNAPTAQQDYDDYFEKHLRELRPVAPRALAIPRRRAPWTALAVAATLLMAAGTSFLARRGQPTAVQTRLVSPPITIGTLNAALRGDEETFNRLLDNASPNILPHSQHGTVLYELGKE